MSGTKKKIAFVVIRYGKDVNGGAEYHCRMLAERLSSEYDVEVLTTCVKNYMTGGNELPKGSEIINGVTVRRFPVRNYVRTTERHFLKKAKSSRRTRQFLFKTGILSTLSYFSPIWKWGLSADIQAQKHSVFYSPEMNRYISANKAKFAAFIALTADYAPFFFTAELAGEKMIAIPTLHNAKVSFRPSLTQAFSKIRLTGFNTDTEQRLAQKIFGTTLGKSLIISTGIETPEAESFEEVKTKFELPDRYMVYVGRVSIEKTGKLFDYYKRYRKINGISAVPLVVVGENIASFRTMEGIKFTGFISDGEKRAIMRNAALMINPSKYESLSLILLEALNDSVPVLVNGHCEVLKDHCRKSGMAVRYYTGCRSFCKEATRILSDDSIRNIMTIKGKEYMNQNYSWDTIMPRLRKAIESISPK